MKKNLLVKFLLFFAVIAALLSCKHKEEVVQKGEPSQNPPGGLKVEQVPQFVSIGFDDNSYVEEMDWIAEYAKGLKNPAGSGNSATYDSTPVTFTFFPNSKYTEEAGEAWKKLYDAGHEIGNHTDSHPHGAVIDWSQGTFTPTLKTEEWDQEIDTCAEALAGLGIAKDDMTGFRTPFLEYTNYTFESVHKKGFAYDCSIEEGFQEGLDGTNHYWPYTLDNGSPGDKVVATFIGGREEVASYPGLWELPVYVLILPPDEKCEEYGIEPGFREKINGYKSYLEGSDWKITGFDYNLWFTDSEEPMMTPAEFTGVLKYNLDLRLSGNRAPFMLGAHIDLYETAERREALEAFIEYALSKPEVRFVNMSQILAWLNDPVAVDDVKTASVK